MSEELIGKFGRDVLAAAVGPARALSDDGVTHHDQPAAVSYRIVEPGDPVGRVVFPPLAEPLDLQVVPTALLDAEGGIKRLDPVLSLADGVIGVARDLLRAAVVDGLGQDRVAVGVKSKTGGREGVVPRREADDLVTGEEFLEPRLRVDQLVFVFRLDVVRLLGVFLIVTAPVGGHGLVGHTVALGLERPLCEEPLPLCEVVGQVRFPRDQHTRTVQPVFFVFLVDPDRGLVEPVVVGHGEHTLRPVLDRRDLGGGAVPCGIGRVVRRRDDLLVPPDETAVPVVLRRGIDGAGGHGVVGGGDRVGGPLDVERNRVGPRRVGVDGVVNLHFFALHIFGGRSDQFGAPTDEGAHFARFGQVGFVSRRRRRRLAFVDVDGDDPARHIEADAVDRQPVFRDRRGIGDVFGRRGKFLVPTGNRIVMLVGLPTRLAGIFRDLPRGDGHLGHVSVDREFDGVARPIPVRAAGGEQEQAGKDQSKREKRAKQTFHGGKLLPIVVLRKRAVFQFAGATETRVFAPSAPGTTFTIA